MKTIFFAIILSIPFMINNAQSSTNPIFFQKFLIDPIPEEWQRYAPNKTCTQYCYDRAISDCIKVSVDYCLRKRQDCIEKCRSLGYE